MGKGSKGRHVGLKGVIILWNGTFRDIIFRNGTICQTTIYLNIYSLLYYICKFGLFINVATYTMWLFSK